MQKTLKTALRALGIKQRGLARALGISEAAMSHIANGTVDIPARLVLDLARETGIPVQDVLVLCAKTSPTKDTR